MNQNTEINKSLNYYRKYKENCTRLNSKTKTHEKKIYIWNKNINLYSPLLGGFLSGGFCHRCNIYIMARYCLNRNYIFFSVY